MAIRKSRAAFHSSLCFSFKDQISLNPLTSLKLYKSVILPTFLYGCEVWNNMSTSTLKSIEVFHHYCLKKIQFLPKTTRSAMCQTLLGVGSLLSEVDKRKIMFSIKLHFIRGLFNEADLSKKIVSSSTQNFRLIIS